jgi:glycosyltransferase involved in cell wall biosynthesis
MPCLNEGETIGICIEKAQKFLRDYQINGEVIIADNGSSDESVKIAQGMGARVINVSDKGYGAALLGGIGASLGKYIIMGDSDNSYNFMDLMRFLEKLRDGYDLVMGNRFKGQIMPGAMPPLHRYFGNPILTGIGKLFFHGPVNDFHCGMRGFSRESVIRMDLRTNGMEFASEMVIKAILLKMKITETPIDLYPDGRTRPPHLRSWRDGWRHLRFMLVYSPKWLFLYPGIAFMILGLGVGSWLLPGPKPFMGTILDIHTLLYAALCIIIGFQAITFSILTRVFATISGLIPSDVNSMRVFKYIKLETGLVVGAALFLLGSIGSVYFFIQWGQSSFGPLDPTKTFRIVIPIVLMIALGLQTILTSFFLSLLGLQRMGVKTGDPT